MKKLLPLIAIIMVMVLLICSWGCTEKENKEYLEKKVITVDTDKALVITKTKEETLTAYANQKALWDFSSDLVKGSYASDDILLSPLSVYIALAMLCNGAGSTTKDGILQTLGLDEENANAYASYLLQLYTEESEVQLANSIWYRESFPPKDSFLQTNTKYYNAEIYKSSFDNQTVKDVNNWVKDNTNDLIDKIIDDIDQNTIMMLLNAISFMDKWNDPFEFTTKKNFNNYAGKEVSAEFLSRTLHSYRQTDNALAFSYAFENSRYSFVGVLPNEDIDSYIGNFDSEELEELLTSKVSGRAVCSLPVFSKKYEITLNDILSDMGMREAFGGNADFSDGWDVVRGTVQVDQVRHKSFIDVNKNGVKAAAVTIIEMKANSAYDEREPIYITLDRPFVYMLVDNDYNIPLFIGTVTNV